MRSGRDLVHRARDLVLESGNQGRTLRYLITAGVTAAIYTGLTLLLSAPLGVPIQLAIPVSFVIAIVAHFLLQRYFVFHDAEEFAISWHGQAARYVVICSIQYVITAAATGLLPSVLGVSEQIVYLVTVLIISVATFLILRSRVFHEPQPR